MCKIINFSDIQQKAIDSKLKNKLSDLCRDKRNEIRFACELSQEFSDMSKDKVSKLLANGFFTEKEYYNTIDVKGNCRRIESKYRAREKALRKKYSS